MESWVSGIDQNYLQTTLQTYQTQLENYLTQTHPDATVGEVLGMQTIIPANRPVLAAGLPYQVVARGNTFAMLPASLRHSLTVKLYDSAVAQSMDNPSLVHTLTLSDLASHRLGITYVPATANDTQVLEEFALAGAETLPVYVVKLKPVLELDGIEVVAGQAVGMGQAQYYTLLLKDPETTYPLSGTLNAGDEIVFGVNGNGMAPPVVSKRLEIVTSNGAAENLHQVALHYWLESDLLNELIAKIAGVHQFRLPSVGLFSSPLGIEWLFGIPRTGSYKGRAMDIKHARLAAIGPDNPTRLNFMKQAGLQSSYLEGSIFEQLFKLQPSAVSAAQFLEAAVTQGISLFTLTQANVATALPLLSIDESLKDTLGQAVQAGRTVVIPQRELTIGKYTGIGYVIYDPVTGSGAYMIDGGFNGGRQSSCVGSTEPQVGIIDPVVIALFGFVGDPSKYQVVTNPVWRQLLLRLLVMPQVMAPLAMAVGISVSLIVIAVIVRRTMQEAELESTIKSEERCKNCRTEYPDRNLCSEVSHYPCESKGYALFGAGEYFQGQTQGLLPVVEEGYEDPARPSSSCGKPGTHIELELVLPPTLVASVGKPTNHPGSIISCHCCRDTSMGPKLEELWGVTTKSRTFQATDKSNGTTYTLFDESSSSRLLIDSELPGCTW